MRMGRDDTFGPVSIQTPASLEAMKSDELSLNGVNGLSPRPGGAENTNFTWNQPVAVLNDPGTLRKHSKAGNCGELLGNTFIEHIPVDQI